MTPAPPPPPALARAFLALPCGAALGRTLFGAALAALGGEESARRAFRLPRPEGLHATLFFLGDVERERLEGLWAAVREELAGTAAPALVVDGAGAFPKRGRERVLWLGVREETRGRLKALHRGTLAAVRRAGFDASGEERRPYRPHVTVARPRPGTRVPEGFYDLAPGVAWTADEVALLESLRAETGPPVYEALERVGLARYHPGTVSPPGPQAPIATRSDFERSSKAELFRPPAVRNRVDRMLGSRSGVESDRPRPTEDHRWQPNRTPPTSERPPPPPRPARRAP